jgi:hypothetical protein
MIGIIECARNIRYKSLFSNAIVLKGKPDIIYDRPIYSWENIIKSFIDEDKYEQFIYLHAEMKLLSFIINNKIKSREFIAVSKRCCYLCELYIDFAWEQGYRIFVPGNHKKIYSGWKLPHVEDSNFKINSLRYILENLDQIIGNKINHYTRSLPADSDSGVNSPDPSHSDGKYVAWIY